MKRYSVKEYAALTGTTKAAVYKKLETSLKPYVVKEGKRTFLVFQDDSTFNPNSTPDSTPFQPIFNPDGTENSTPGVERLTGEVERLKAVLEAKEAHLKDLQDQLDRLAAELEQERQAGKELRQLLNQQQALTAKHLAEPKKRPLLAAIFPRLYNREDDQGQE
jgi:uncharacterized phage infection (PIP) family protein YhgE